MPIVAVWPLTAASPLDLKGQFKFEFNNYLRSALTLRGLSSLPVSLGRATCHHAAPLKPRMTATEAVGELDDRAAAGWD